MVTASRDKESRETNTLFSGYPWFRWNSKGVGDVQSSLIDSLQVLFMFKMKGNAIECFLSWIMSVTDDECNWVVYFFTFGILGWTWRPAEVQILGSLRTLYECKFCMDFGWSSVEIWGCWKSSRQRLYRTYGGPRCWSGLLQMAHH